MLSEQAIDEFKTLYLKRYGVALDHNSAAQRATGLIGLYKAVYGENINMSIKHEKKTKPTNSAK